MHTDRPYAPRSPFYYYFTAVHPFGATPFLRLPFRCILIIVSILGPSIASATAAIEWSRQSVSISAPSGTPKVSAVFPFRNTGVKAVKFVRIQPSCDCVTVRSVCAQIEPGQQGQIEAEFVPGDRTGRQEKVIEVFDDVQSTPTELRLIVELPEPVSIRPRFVYWVINESPSEKIFEVAIDASVTELKNVSCSDTFFTAKLAKTSGSKMFRISIQPNDTKQIRQTTIRLTATVGGVNRVYVLYAAIK